MVEVGGDVGVLAGDDVLVEVREIPQPPTASRINALYGAEDTIVTLRFQQAVDPGPQHLETIDREGNLVSDVTIEDVAGDEGGRVLVGSLPSSACFQR